MTPARRLSIAVLLLVVGVVLLYLSTSQVWFELHSDGKVLGAPSEHFKGSDDNGFGALALGALAAGAALIATRGRARLAVAAITVVIALGIGGLAIHAVNQRDALLTRAGSTTHLQGVFLSGSRDEQTTAWPYVAVLAAVLILLGAIAGATAARGGGSLSARYEPPTGDPPAPVAAVPGQADVALWQALDRDEDPTGG